MPSRIPGQLRDVIAPDLRLLFVGINPGLRSAEIGHHFGGLSNPFWRLLHAAGLTREVIAPEDDRHLLEHRLPVTNLCPRPSRSATELSREERMRGARTVVDECDGAPGRMNEPAIHRKFAPIGIQNRIEGRGPIVNFFASIYL